MAELRVQLEIRMTQPMFRAGLIGALLLVCAPELDSESVTLSTYYPAPSGVYTSMITTKNTWLARNAVDGEGVVIGSVGPLPGNATRLSVTGNSGFGTLDAGTTRVRVVGNAAGVGLHVSGTGGSGNEPLRVESAGRFFSGVDGAGAPRFAINNDAGPALNFFGSDSGWFNFMSVDNAGTRMVAFPGAYMTVGAAGAGTLIVRQGGCYEKPYVAGSTACNSAGEYATFQTGIMSKNVLVGNSPASDGTMYCCPCPSNPCLAP